MQNVIRGGGVGEENTYRTVLRVFENFETYSLDPDIYSYSAVLSACASANPSDHEQSLIRCLKTLEMIRRQSMVSDSTYYLVLQVVSRVGQRLTQQQRDIVAVTILSSCCEDGWLKSYERYQLKRLMSKSAWQKFYSKRLRGDGKEPLKWSRKIQHDMDVA